jgi:hypothetical protein
VEFPGQHEGATGLPAGDSLAYHSLHGRYMAGGLLGGESGLEQAPLRPVTVILAGDQSVAELTADDALYSGAGTAVITNF